MRGVTLLALLVILFASCFTSKSMRYDTIYRMRGYGKLESLKNANKQFYFRYHITNVVLDIWSDDLRHYRGKIICYTVSHGKNGYKYLGTNFRVSDSLTDKIIHEFDKLNIMNILIKDSADAHHIICADCGIHEYEYSNGVNYFHKEYFSASAIKAIDSFEHCIDININPDKKFDEFIDQLPKGVYQRNRIEVIKD